VPSIAWWASTTLSLVGLTLGIRGVMLVAFAGVLGSKVRLLSLYMRFLFRRQPYADQPAMDREPSLVPWPTEQETRGWRLMIWGFTLQGLSVVLGIVERY
jgi:hypothetical protein